MATDPILYAAPLFAVSLFSEGLCLRGTSRAYSFRRVASALGCLAYDQLVNTATAVAFLGAFAAVHRTLGTEAFDNPSTVWMRLGAICLAVFLHDALYYAYHRLSHRVNILWAVHVVHHQSRYYDLTVSLRQGTIATWVTYVFYMPMALLVSPLLFVQVHAAYQIYQFFVHTELIRRMGIAEWFLATPSHHRVHHGRDRAYLDRNYGGFFIIFDRLLGTFTEERHAPNYGVPGDYDDARPGFANLYLFARLLRLSTRTKGLRHLAQLWFGPPEASPELTSSAKAPRASNPTVAGISVCFGLAFAVVALFVPASVGMRFAIGILALVLIESGLRFLRSSRASI